MTHTNTNKNKQTSPSEESIISYLCENTNFLIENRSLLKEIMIPHLLESNMSSLIERQVEILREENSELENNFEKYKNTSMQKSILRKNIFNFFLESYSVENVTEYTKLVHLFFDRYFDASYIRMYIFDNKMQYKKRNLSIERKDSKLRFMFTEIFSRSKPLCSSLQTEQLQMLFDTDAEKIQSNLLIPVEHSGFECLLALGSNKNGQFGIGDDLDLLVFVSKLAVFKLKNLLID